MASLGTLFHLRNFVFLSSLVPGLLSLLNCMSRRGDCVLEGNMDRAWQYALHSLTSCGRVNDSMYPFFRCKGQQQLIHN